MKYKLVNIQFSAIHLKVTLLQKNTPQKNQTFAMDPETIDWFETFEFLCLHCGSTFETVLRDRAQITHYCSNNGKRMQMTVSFIKPTRTHCCMEHPKGTTCVKRKGIIPQKMIDATFKCNPCTIRGKIRKQRKLAQVKEQQQVTKTTTKTSLSTTKSKKTRKKRRNTWSKVKQFRPSISKQQLNQNYSNPSFRLKEYAAVEKKIRQPLLAAKMRKEAKSDTRVIMDIIEERANLSSESSLDLNINEYVDLTAEDDLSAYNNNQYNLQHSTQTNPVVQTKVLNHNNSNAIESVVFKPNIRSTNNNLNNLNVGNINISVNNNSNNNIRHVTYAPNIEQHGNYNSEMNIGDLNIHNNLQDKQKEYNHKSVMKVLKNESHNEKFVDPFPKLTPLNVFDWKTPFWNSLIEVNDSIKNGLSKKLEELITQIKNGNTQEKLNIIKQDYYNSSIKKYNERIFGKSANYYIYPLLAAYLVHEGGISNDTPIKILLVLSCNRLIKQNTLLLRAIWCLRVSIFKQNNQMSKMYQSIAKVKQYTVD